MATDSDSPGFEKICIVSSSELEALAKFATSITEALTAAKEAMAPVVKIHEALENRGKHPPSVPQGEQTAPIDQPLDIAEFLEQLPDCPDGGLLSVENLKEAWNEQADRANSWDELGIDEIVWWAQHCALSLRSHSAASPCRVMQSACAEGANQAIKNSGMGPDSAHPVALRPDEAPYRVNIFPVEYADSDGDGIRILMEPSEETNQVCWTVRNSRHVNPCHEFPSPEDAYAAHRAGADKEAPENPAQTADPQTLHTVSPRMPAVTAQQPAPTAPDATVAGSLEEGDDGGGWIRHRLPHEADADEDGDVLVKCRVVYHDRLGWRTGGLAYANYRDIVPSQPWKVTRTRVSR